MLQQMLQPIFRSAAIKGSNQVLRFRLYGLRFKIFAVFSKTFGLQTKMRWMREEGGLTAQATLEVLAGDALRDALRLSSVFGYRVERFGTGGLCVSLVVPVFPDSDEVHDCMIRDN